MDGLRFNLRGLEKNKRKIRVLVAILQHAKTLHEDGR